MATEIYRKFVPFLLCLLFCSCNDETPQPRPQLETNKEQAEPYATMPMPQSAESKTHSLGQSATSGQPPTPEASNTEPTPAVAVKPTTPPKEKDMMTPTSEQLELRNRLIAEIMKQYDQGERKPIVSLESFFNGNWHEMSLAPNQVGYGRASFQKCREVLVEIQKRSEVQTVLVTINECPEANEPLDYDIWPSADEVYVLTSATREELTKWAAPLAPTYIGTGWTYSRGKKPMAAPDPLPGYHVFAIQWD